MTLAELIQLLLMLFRGGQPAREVFLRLELNAQRSAQRLPFLSKRLLLLQQRLRLAFIPL